MPRPLTITINYPTPENETEFEQRAAEAMAKVLFYTLPPEVIDELIDKYESNKNIAKR